MSNHDWKQTDEREFDAEVKRCLPELPPQDVVKTVTPWRKAMNRVFVGMALSTLSLRFCNLDSIFPAIGLILLFLGLRMLRKENVWFRACWVTTILRMLCLFPVLILQASILQKTVRSNANAPLFLWISLLLLLGQWCFLWLGLRAVQRKAGAPVHNKTGVALAGWFLLTILLATVGYQGIVLMLGIVAGYVLIFWSLFRMSRELDEAGYAIGTSVVKVSDWAVLAVLVATVLAGIGCGYLFLNRYPMQWTKTTADSAETTEIKTNLQNLGFPANIVNDLTEEDVLACKGALQVVADTQNYAISQPGAGTDKAAQPLQITGIAVKLPGGQNRWKYFHHFRWLENPGFYGTESLQIWTAYRNDGDGWADCGEPMTGRVLYTDDDGDYTAAYYSMGSEDYVAGDLLFGQNAATTAVFASFSMPWNKADCRGYISYTALQREPKGALNSWLNYTHQTSWLQYPVLTAEEQRKATEINEAGVFYTIQTALFMNETEEGTKN